MTENVGGIVYTVDVDTAETVNATKRVNKELDNLDKGFKKADSGSRSLSSSIKDANGSFSSGASAIKRFIAPLLSAAAAMAALRKLVDVQRQFDVLNAGLITATGSAENAAIAFDALQQFAAKTPYDLAQATKAFTQLVNLGLTPSEEALMSYGNTASAMGKDLSQLVEAVADAATGEFERLKEFGIRSKKEGDKISFTFQGVTTTVKNNASEIEGYLIGLGQNQFAGAMEKRMQTLDGAISNLGDTWDATFRTIAASGAGDAIESAVRMATDALQEFNDSLASGQLEGYIDAIVGKFDGFGADIDATFAFLTGMIEGDTDRWADKLSGTVSFMIDAFKNFPENVRSLIQIMTVEVLAGFDKASAYAMSFKDGVKAIFSDDTLDDVAARLEQQLATVEATRQDSISSILTERDQALDSFAKQTAAADELRKTYDELNASKAGQGDRLAGFKVSGAGESADSGAAEVDPKEAARVKKEAQKLAELREKEEQKARKEAGEKMAAQQAMLGQADPLIGEQQRFETELANLRTLNEAKLLEDQRYLDLKTQAEAAHAQQMQVLREQDFAAQSATNALLLDSLNQIQQGATDAFVGVLTGATNSREAVQQLAQSILKDAIGALVKMGIENVKTIVMGQAAQAAAAGTAAATGAAMTASYAPAAAAASIASFGSAAGAGLTALASAIPAAIGLFSGKALGGPVQANQMYRVNETGAPEIFNAANGRQYMMPNQRGEVVSNKDATGGGGGSNVVINITNNTGAQVSTSEAQVDNQRIIDVVVGDMMSDGRIAQATNRITGTPRAGQ